MGREEAPDPAPASLSDVQQVRGPGAVEQEHTPVQDVHGCDGSGRLPFGLRSVKVGVRVSADTVGIVVKVWKWLTRRTE